MQRTIALLIMLLLPLAEVAHAGSMDAQLREQVARSVVQVQARGCPDGDRVASGFAFGPDQHVVTALHVVSGCQRLSVYWEKHGGATQQAQVVRVLNDADLALLHASGAPGRALAHSSNKPQANAELEALGYYLAVPTMDNKPLRVTFGSSRLRDMLPGGVRKELEKSGAIDLNLDIVRLDGHLLPGLSGAPIFDLSGRVVAIGSGGLKSGAASVSWAVPASHLQALLTSVDRMASGRGSSHLFAAAVLDEGGQQAGNSAQQVSNAFVCGGVRFVYTGTRTFYELTQGHDDLASIQYMIGEASLTDADLAGFRYHTYQPVDGGSAVAIPEWTSLQYVGGTTCQARGLNNRITVDFAGRLVRNLVEADQVSRQFGDTYANWSQRQWQRHDGYSYIGPMTRADGLVSNRATYLALEPNGMASVLMRTFLVHQPFASAAPTFTGIIGSYWSFNLQAAAYCSDAPHSQGCGPYNQEEKLVSQLMLGVFLSTAPLI